VDAWKAGEKKNKAKRMGKSVQDGKRVPLFCRQPAGKGSERRTVLNHRIISQQKKKKKGMSSQFRQFHIARSGLGDPRGVEWERILATVHLLFLR